jgi:alanine racemase
MRAAVAEIDLAALRHNVAAIKQRVSPAKVMAVVKADAYGHGAVAVANAAIQAGAQYLGVALVEEGIELRQAGILAPTLVFGGVMPDQITQFLEFDLEMTVYTLEIAEQISRHCQALGQSARIHVKVDTGMNRVGVQWESARDVIQKIQKLPRLKLVGLSTHFATSDEKDKAYANLQLSRFRQVVAQLSEMGIKIPLKHAANSGAILDMPEAYFDMVRPGMLLYGWYPSRETSESIAIRPVMCFKTRVLHVKEIAMNETVSYGRKFKAGEPTRIATLPVGYADGYNRLLSNRGQVLIRGEKFPVAGRVCMDLIHANIGQNQKIGPGDEVVLFGKQGDAEVSVYEICELLNTIPYEVCCWVSKRVPRIYLDSERKQAL